MVFTVFLLLHVALQAQVRSLDSLRLILPDLEGRARVDALNDLTKGIMYTSPDEAFDYTREVLMLSDEMDYTEAKAYSWVYQGIMFNNKADYNKADSVLKMAVSISEDIEFQWGIAYGSICLGVKSILLQEYNEAVAYFLTSLEAARTMERPDVETTCLMNLGSVQQLTGDFESARHYYTEALKIAESDNRVPRIRLGEILGNLGNNSVKERDFGTALKYYERCLAIFREFDQKAQIANTLLNMGLIYKDLAEYDQAMVLYNQSEELFAELESKRDLSTVYREMGEVLLESREYEKAIQRLNEGLEMRPAPDDEYFNEAHLFLSRAHEALSQPQLALDYYKKHIAYKDSLNTKSKKDELAQVTADFEQVRRENATEIADQLAEIQALKIRQRNMALLSVSIISIVIMVWLVLNRRRLKTELIITQKDRQLAEKEIEIRSNTFEIEKDKLIDYANQLLAKNKSLEEKREELEQNKKEDTPEVTDLLNRLRTTIAEEKDWAAFHIYFDNVYTDFFEQVQTRFPLDFTQYEKRLMALIKTGMSNKEIADILSISRNSVVRSKSRLRDKMDFKETRHLEDFLSHL